MFGTQNVLMLLNSNFVLKSPDAFVFKYPILLPLNVNIKNIKENPYKIKWRKFRYGNLKRDSNCFHFRNNIYKK